MIPHINPYNGAFNQPDFGTFIENSENLIKSIINNKSTYISKWMTIIESGFDGARLDNDMLEKICLYCEVYSAYYASMGMAGYKTTGKELISVVNDIKSKIQNKETVRSEVKSKVYNYNTGQLEYELMDGQFIKIENEKVSGPSINISDDIFHEKFVKLIDISSYRDIKIDKLL